MKLNFDTSTSSLKESALIAADFVAFLEDNQMYYYFPFKSLHNISDEAFMKQIEVDVTAHAYNDACKALQATWIEVEAKVTEQFRKINKTKIETYRCVPTFYGPYGYYYAPDTVYVNITNSNPTDWVETLVHEILHLVLYAETSNMSHQDMEKYIDTTFVNNFGDIFPDYKIQQ